MNAIVCDTYVPVIRHTATIGWLLVVLWRCSCISYFEQYSEYDPFITPPECFSPWISDTTEFWEQEATLYVRARTVA